MTAWTLLGVSAVFSWAVYRLGSRGLDTIRNGLETGEWVFLALLLPLFAYGEGVVALDRRWVPKLIERARALREDRRVLLWALAPLYGLSLVGTAGRDLARGWLGTGAVVTAVLLVRTLPEPWRGIIDFCVAIALAWGLVAILRRLPGEMESVQHAG